MITIIATTTHPKENNSGISKVEFFALDIVFTTDICPKYTAISIYVVGSKPQAYNPESLKLIIIYPYHLSVLSRTLEALIRQRKLK